MAFAALLVLAPVEVDAARVLVAIIEVCTDSMASLTASVTELMAEATAEAADEAADEGAARAWVADIAPVADMTPETASLAVPAPALIGPPANSPTPQGID